MAASTSVPVVVSSTASPLRVMAPPAAASPTVVQRALPQPLQQRMIRPGATIVRPTAQTIKSTVAVTNLRPPIPTVQKAPMLTSTIKTVTSSTQGKTVNTATTNNKTIVPFLVTKPTAKEKEKKTFSSAGYT